MQNLNRINTVEILYAHRPHKPIQLVFSIVRLEMVTARCINSTRFQHFFRLLIPTEKSRNVELVTQWCFSHEDVLRREVFNLCLDPADPVSPFSIASKF